MHSKAYQLILSEEFITRKKSYQHQPVVSKQVGVGKTLEEIVVNKCLKKEQYHDFTPQTITHDAPNKYFFEFFLFCGYLYI